MGIHALKTPSGTLDDVSGRRRRTNAPREKRGGISLPVHLWQALDLICDLQTSAFDQMGGQTKASVSDEIELGMETHVRDFIKRHGSLPQTAAERVAYVKKLAAALLAELNEDLNQQ